MADHDEPLILWDTDEVARRLSVCIRTVKSLIADGQLESVKIGRARRVPAGALAAYVSRLRGGHAEDAAAAGQR
jgi:excisionase family DNA binding protein